MKKWVIIFIILLLPIASSANRCFDSDGGQKTETAGMVSYSGNSYRDYCISESSVKEYFCTANGMSNSNMNCLYGCSGGACISSTCTLGECNLVQKKWCDQAPNWVTSGYDDECGLKDFDMNQTNCIENVCDYVNHKYCKNGKWYSNYYCDDVYCGDNKYSLDYCFCSNAELENCANNKDDDCDGAIDCNDPECDCECFEGETQECGSDVGECVAGIKECINGIWGGCSDIEGVSEICDNRDNDCDNEIDEGCECIEEETRDCGSDVGVCNAGTQYCVNGKWSICYGGSYAASDIEECNAVDDDCDGEIDEGCGCVHGNTQECGSDVGLCRKGTQTCISGGWGECLGGVEPFAEVCGDELDNDCDGKIDSDDENCASAEVIANIPVETNEQEEEEEVVVEQKEENTIVTEKRETSENEFNWLLIILPGIALFLIAGIILYIGRKKRKYSPREQQGVQREAPREQQQRVIAKPIAIIKKKATGIETALEDSFKKAKELFGK